MIDFKNISNKALSRNMKGILSDIKNNKKFKDIKTNMKFEAIFKNFIPVNVRLKDNQSFVFPINFAFNGVKLNTIYANLNFLNS